MDFRILGPLEVLQGSQRVEVNGRKQRTILCTLLLHAGDVVPDDRLVDVVWGDEVPSKPQNALQAQVSQLRRTLGPQAEVVRRSPGYALAVTAADVDAGRFEAWCASARGRVVAGDLQGALAQFDQALGLWRGEPFADVADLELFRGTATRLADLRLAAIEDRIEVLLGSGAHVDAAAELEVLVHEHPLRERLWVQQMIALYRAGRQADALRAYAEARERLIEELGIEPGPELRHTEARVLAHDPTLDGPAPARLPLGSTEGRQGRTEPAGDGALRTPPVLRLRAALTTFVGRASELAELADVVSTNRLVTLLGPGGVGKTRLALQVARAVADRYADGACFADLAPVVDERTIAVAVATALGVLDSRDPATAPVTDQDMLQQISDHLLGRSALVVLDNCEHVIVDAAGVAARLLVTCPGLTLLATSREALGLPGEVHRRVDPLQAEDASALFLDRAHALGTVGLPDQAGLVAELCARLDGLPLAIELAAARTRVLSLSDLLARLDDRFAVLTAGGRTALPRQQTMRAVVDWSFDLLFDDERCLFRRLSVFSGGCTLAAAQAVCTDDELPEVDFVEVLGRLVEKSLLVAEPDADGAMRYRQLQTLRDYARERLLEAGESALVEARHARWALDLAAVAERGLRSGRAPEWRRALEAELGNLRAALDHLIGRGAGDEARQLAVSLAWLWFLRSDWPEGRRWLDDALAVSNHSDAAWHGLAMAWSGYFGAFMSVPLGELPRCEHGVAALRTVDDDYRLGEALLLLASTRVRAGAFAAALDALAEARDHLEPLEDRWAMGVLELLTATAQLRMGAVAEGTSAVERSIAHLRALGDPYLLIEALVYRGVAAEAIGDDEAMLNAYEEAARLPREHDAPGYLSMTLTRVANAYALQGRFAEAEDLHRESVTLRTSPLTHAFALLGRATTMRRVGDHAAAAPMLDDALQIYSSMGLVDGQVACVLERAWCAAAAADPTGARENAVSAAGLASCLADPRPELASIEALAASALAEGQPLLAARFLATAAARRRGCGLEATTAERVNRADVLAGVVRVLGDEAVARSAPLPDDASFADLVALLDAAIC